MKKYSLLLCSLLVSLFFVIGCNHSNKKSKGGGDDNKDPDIEPPITSETVTTDEAFNIIQKNKGNKNFVIFDVRTNSEFKEGYLQGHLEESEEEPYRGVLQYDRYADDFDQFISKLDKNKRYLIHCRTDKRSKDAFDMMKAKEFKKIQYMLGGYTQWAKEHKPIVIPEYEKAVDVQVTADKVKTNSTIKFDLLVTDLDNNPLRKAKLSLQIFLGTTEIEKQDIEASNKGIATYTFNAASKEKGSYRLVCTGTHKAGSGELYKPVEVYYYFDVADQDEAVGGDSSEITPSDDGGITAEMAKKFYNRNIYGYKVYDRNRNVVSLAKSVDATKPTMVIFFSPSCGGCMVKAQELDKYNLESINFVPVITSVSDDDPDESLEEKIKKAENKLINDFNLGSIVPHALYDAKDKIWFSRFKFTITPQFVLINKEGQVKDIIYGSDDINIKAILDKMQTKFNLPAFKLK